MALSKEMSKKKLRRGLASIPSAKSAGGEFKSSAKVTGGDALKSAKSIKGDMIKGANVPSEKLKSSAKTTKMVDSEDSYSKEKGYYASPKKKIELMKLRKKFKKKGLNFMSPSDIEKKLKKIEGK